jgi:hypothetical protein
VNSGAYISLCVGNLLPACVLHSQLIILALIIQVTLHEELEYDIPDY